MLDLPLLLEQLLVILAAAWCAGRVVRVMGQPRVIGEMAAGIALGPSLFGAIAPQLSGSLFPASGLAPLATISQLGVLLFMFVVGLRLDLTALRQRAQAAVLVSHASIVAPFLLGTVLAAWLYPALAGQNATGEVVSLLPFALFMGAAMSVTAFPVLARILAERKLLGTRMGAVAIASAAVDDVTAWCMLAGVVAVARHGDGLRSFAVALLSVSLFAALLIVGARRVLHAFDASRLARRDRQMSAANYTAGDTTEVDVVVESVGAEVIGIAILFALACALVTEKIGVHAVFGAFLAGAIMPRESGLAHALAERMEAVVSTVFLPVFFAFSGLRTEIGLLSSPALWGICVVVLTAAIVGKFGGATTAARMVGMSWRDAIGVGILMNTRGLMELVVLNVGLELGVISKTMFAIMVVMALVTTVMTSPLLALVLRGQREVQPVPAPT